MNIFIIAGILSFTIAGVVTAVTYFKEGYSVDDSFSKGLIAFISSCFFGALISLILNLIVSMNLSEDLIKTESFPITKIEGYDKYAYVKASSDRPGSPFINLTYINDDQPVGMNESITGIKVYDLEPGEKPCVVFKHYRDVESNWTFFRMSYTTSELHLNQDQIGIIYEKQKQPKVEQE